MREKLIQCRKKAGFTQKSLAGILEISERMYVYIEAGDRHGRPEIWDTLEAMFGVPQRELRVVTSTKCERHPKAPHFPIGAGKPR